MPTVTKYAFSKLMDIPSLVTQIQASSIVTVLDHIDATDSECDVWFKDALSSEDETTLGTVVDNYAYIAPPGPPAMEVVTQYEKNDKTLKLARDSGTVDENGTVTLYFKVPGTFGSGDGRFVVGGYGISEDYNKDDYVIVRVEDKDRIIAMMIAQAGDPNATEPVSDETVQGIGVIPGLDVAFPAYPMIRSYTDEDAAEENRGWYFWPLAQGNNLPPVGEIEVNPIGGYGFIPSGFYVKLIYQRPNGVTTGSFRSNIDWGRKE